MRFMKFQRRRTNRDGTAIAETAVVLPVFFVILFGFIEFGHVFLTIHSLNSAARRAARLGVSDGTTTTQVETLAKEIVGAAFKVQSASVFVKDASAFDAADADAENVDHATLPNIELGTAERRQLFMVRVSVNYADIAILGPRWMGNIQLYGQAVMRKE